MVKLSGYAIVFDSLSENMGGFKERIAPSAVDRTLRERVDLRGLVNHNPEAIVGRQSVNTLRVAKDKYGLHIELDAPDSPRGQDLVEAVTRGDISGMSFAFLPWPGGTVWERGSDVPIVTVQDSLIREVSAVSFPAYSATSLRLHNPKSATERLHRMDVAPFATTTTAKRAHAHGSREALLTRSTDGGEQLVTTMLRAPGGEPIRQTRLLRELAAFKLALAQAPHVRRDEHGAFVWSPERGWHSRGARPRVTVAEMERRLKAQGHQIGEHR